MINYNFKKKYGQNFLIDVNILNKIIASVNPSPRDLIVEIGAGCGNLTQRLQSYQAQLISYEIDEEAQKYLEALNNQNTKIIYDDFLKRDINQDIQSIEYEKLYIIANLPYYITTPIIEKIIDTKLNPIKMILMVQKEVAERISAVPGSKHYGFITAFLNYHFKIKKLFNVNKNAFQPIPKVDSAILEFEKHDIYQVKDELKLVQLLKDAFQYKRKNLNNNFKNYNKEEIEKILNQHGFSLTDRAEKIPIQVFIEIANNPLIK